MKMKSWILLCSLFTVTSASAFNKQEITQIINQKKSYPYSFALSKTDSQFNWQYLNGPAASHYFRMVQMKNNVDMLFAYKAGSRGLVYKSIDGGKHWKALTTPINMRLNHLLSLNENELLLCAGEKIYRSQDQGENWTLLASLKVECQRILALNEKVLMLETNLSMYRSLDQGKTWVPAQLGLSSDLDYMVGKNNFIIVNASDGVYVSQNAGVTWSNPESLRIPVFSLDEAFAINSKNEVYVAAKALYRFDFSCKRETLVNTKMDFSDIAVDALDNLYALVRDKNYDKSLHKSTDGGLTWECLYPLNKDYDINKFKLLENGTVLLYTNKGVLKSDLTQKKYSLIPLASSNLRTEKVLVRDKNNIYALDSDGKDNLYQSHDAGQTWSSVSKDFTHDIAVFNGKALAIAWHNKTISLFSENSSAEKPIRTFKDEHRRCSMFSNNGGLIVNCGSDNAYFTKDLTQWDTLNVPSIRKAYYDGENIYLSNYVYNAVSIKRSTDQGKTWTTLLDDLFFGADALTGYHDNQSDIVLIAFPHAGIIKTEDGGVNWDLINNGLTTYQFNDLIALNKNEYIAATNEGVFYTHDGGNHWSAQNKGLINQAVSSLSAEKNNLFAATLGAGVFKTTIH